MTLDEPRRPCRSSPAPTATGPSPSTWCASPARSWSSSTSLDGEDGSWALTLSGVADAAGNALAPQEVATLVLDGTAPALVGYTQSAAKLNGKDTLVVEFSASEDLREPPAVKLGTWRWRARGPGGAYLFSLPVAGTTMLGEYGVQVAMIDLAGNAALHAPGSPRPTRSSRR